MSQRSDHSGFHHTNFRPQKMERLGCGLMEDKYSFHKTLWTWKMDEKGYLIVTKKAIKPMVVGMAIKGFQ